MHLDTNGSRIVIQTGGVYTASNRAQGRTTTEIVCLSIFMYGQGLINLRLR